MNQRRTETMKPCRQGSLLELASGLLPQKAGDQETPISAALLKTVDLGLGAIIFVAPHLFGGRHPLGRFVIVALCVVTAIAWFARQLVLPHATMDSLLCLDCPGAGGGWWWSCNWYPSLPTGCRHFLRDWPNCCHSGRTQVHLARTWEPGRPCPLLPRIHDSHWLP